MTALVRIHLVGLPLDIHQRSAEHAQEVMREFSHLSEGPSRSHAPARLIQLHRMIGERFSAFVESAGAELRRAADSGEAVADVVYEVPPEAVDAARQLASIWDEVDDYCRQGRFLLALESPPEQVAYRGWFLGEFARQISGEEPLSWDEWSRRRAE